DGVNQPPKSKQVVLFTPAWGPSTPTVAGSSEVVFDSFPAAAVNADLTAPVTAQASGGGTPIPPGGAVLMSVGAPPLQAEAQEGTSVTVRLILPGGWGEVTSARGGGRALGAGGGASCETSEPLAADRVARRDARAAVGQLPDGRIVLVAVDGGQPGYSVGLTNFELAETMAGLGAVTAAALDSGGAVTAAFDGRVL